MVSRIRKWDDSAGVPLDSEILERAKIDVGDDVEVVAEYGQIVIRKASVKRVDIKALIAMMPDDYEVQEEGWGGPVGREVW